VTAFDEFDNVATGYTGTIGFEVTDTAATFPGNYTFTEFASLAHAHGFRQFG
jgi:hypothetical protein